MAYQDFTVTFQRLENSARYRMVTHSPTEGQSDAQFVSPFGEERIYTWRHGLDPDEMHMIGTLLYRRLFAAEICQAFQSTERFAARQGLALRLKLALDSALAQLPWEYLYNPDTHQFLCLEGRLALARHLDVPRAQMLARFADMLEVLMLGAENGTRGMYPLPDNGTVKKYPVDLAAMESGAVAERTAQVLHVRGVGGRDPASGEFALRVMDGVQKQWVTPGRIARWLNGFPALQLIVLEGIVEGEGTLREATAFAAALVARQNVPAAVTFQYPVSPLLRDAFFNAFYRALSKQAGLDLAMTEGRQAISNMDGAWEWGAPVLFSALRDDQPRPSMDTFDAARSLSQSVLASERTNVTVGELAPRPHDSR